MHGWGLIRLRQTRDRVHCTAATDTEWQAQTFSYKVRCEACLNTNNAKIGKYWKLSRSLFTKCPERFLNLHLDSFGSELFIISIFSTRFFFSLDQIPCRQLINISRVYNLGNDLSLLSNEKLENDLSHANQLDKNGKYIKWEKLMSRPFLELNHA